MYDHGDRQVELAKGLIAAYTVIAKILTRLPLPIEIPAAMGPEWTGEQAAKALISADDLIRDIPMDERSKGLIIQMILDWLAAHHFGTFDSMLPALWKLDIVEYSLARITGMAELVEEALNTDEE